MWLWFCAREVLKEPGINDDRGDECGEKSPFDEKKNAKPGTQ